MISRNLVSLNFLERKVSVLHTVAFIHISLYVLSPLFDQIRIGVLLQTLSDVVPDLDQALPCVFQLLTFRETFLRPVQLLEGCFHWPHSFFTLQHAYTTYIITRLIFFHMPVQWQ